MPPFDIQGGAVLALVRGASVAALFSVFGTLLFSVAVARPVLKAGGSGPVDARLRRLALWSVLAAILAALAWLVLESGVLAGADTLNATAAAVPVVVRDTLFGHLILLRVALLLLIALAAWRKWLLPACVLAAIATALQAGHSHAFAMDGVSGLLLSDALHILAAGAWLGGLLPLLLVVFGGTTEAAYVASRRFSPLAMLCVLVVAASAGFQFWVLIGSIPALIGTSYGLMALLKAVLFAGLLFFAYRNRFRHTPGLAHAAPGHARMRLLRSIAFETVLGLAVVLAAGVLTSLPPAMHQPPLWPFSWRPSFVTISEDPDIRREVLGAVLALGGALVLVFAGLLIRRRVRWAVFAAAFGIVWFAVPHLDPLLVQAYPTSFQHSPTGFGATAIARGAALFPQYCAACHGAEGKGNGKLAKSLPVPPADLTAAHLWMHSDGELIWWISHGIEAPRGGMAMPGFADRLPVADRWDLIDYIRAHNAGTMMHGMGMWSPPVHAPDFAALCANGKTVMLHDLRGGIVRIVFGAKPAVADADVRTILAASDGSAHPAGDTCVTGDAAVPRAYAVISGIAAADLAGTEFLIDGKGWLRAVQRAGWTDKETLAAALRQIRMHPIAGGGHPAMHMQM